MRTFLLVLFLIIVLVAARLAYVVIPATGMLSEVEPTDNAQCEALTIAPGTEDVVYDAVTGLVFVSAMERRSGNMHPTNGIYAFDFEARGPVRLVSVDAPADFRPHGISLYREGDIARLFVTSHPPAGDQVLIFDVAEDGTLTHVETIMGEFGASINDVEGTGADSFYVTNDVHLGTGLGGQLEAFLGLPLAGLTYYDGESGRRVAGGFRYANGVHLSPDGSKVYATAFLGREVQVFDRDIETGDLSRIARHKVPLGLDNISLDEGGMIYIAGNPEVFSFTAHQADPSVHAPSQAVKVDPATGEWETVFYTDGTDIDSASVATPAPGALILGAVFDDHVLICPR